MKIYKDFDFIKENTKNDLLIGDGIFKRQDIQDTLLSISLTNKYLLNSSYKALFKDVYIVLSDSPGDGVFAQIDCDAYTRNVFIEMNIFYLIDAYYDKAFTSLVFKESVSLFEFVSFFLLHEAGHIIHCELLVKGGDLFDRINSYAKKYLPFHDALDKKYGYFYYNEKINQIVQKKYRNIPSEKIADSFAYTHFKQIKKSSR